VSAVSAVSAVPAVGLVFIHGAEAMVRNRSPDSRIARERVQFTQKVKVRQAADNSVAYQKIYLNPRPERRVAGSLSIGGYVAITSVW
jgi:hypothetical protein